MNRNITDDSRQVKEDSIFLVTPQNERFLATLPKHIPTIQREDLKQYYCTNIKIIGITGTNGKTTTAAAIYSMLLDMGYNVALLGTRGMFVNNKQIKPKGLTTPKLLELYQDIDMAVQSQCEYFIMEVSSHAIKQERIFGLDFCIKILTNITSDHLDYHKTWEDYAQTKLKFLREGNGIKIINLDDVSGATMRFFPNVLTYGIESKGDCLVDAYSLKDGIFTQIHIRLESVLQKIRHYNVDSNNSKSYQTIPTEIYNNLSINNENKQESGILSSHLFGLFNLYNLMAAILAVRIIVKKKLQEICDVISNFGGVAGRMEIVSIKPLIIVDFAHTADGMQKVFESFKSKKISVVFGAGGNRDVSKRPKMGTCAYNYAHKIYVTNDNPRDEKPEKIVEDILSGMPHNAYTDEAQDNIQKDVKVILDRGLAIRTAILELPKDWVLLVLGKGDECLQVFHDQTIHFSDKECILEVLQTLT